MIYFYEIDDEYINYMHLVDNKILLPKEKERKEMRKYIGVIILINGYKYYIPLSSYKPEVYDNMYESISLMKVKKMAVIRVNNMFPAIDEAVHPINFHDVKDEKYKYLLMAEYREIKTRENELRKNARIVYGHRINKNNKHKRLYGICCDFKKLELATSTYKK
mgnify:CR=1 FL=1